LTKRRHDIPNRPSISLSSRARRAQQLGRIPSIIDSSMDALLSELLEHEGELDGLTSRLQALDLPRRGTPVPPSLRQSIVDLLEACQSAAAHCAATLNAACSFMVLPPELLVLVMQECDSIALSRLAQTAKFLTTCATPSPINSAADAAAKSLFGPALVKLPPKQFSPVMRLRWLERTKLVAPNGP
jgi:hypothetical protein